MIQKILLKGARKIYRKVVHPDFIGNPWPKDEEWETTNTLLTDLFSDDKPCFVGRIGTTEQAVLVNYITVHSKKNYIKNVWIISRIIHVYLFGITHVYQTTCVCILVFSLKGIYS